MTLGPFYRIQWREQNAVFTRQISHALTCQINQVALQCGACPPLSQPWMAPACILDKNQSAVAQMSPCSLLPFVINLVFISSSSLVLYWPFDDCIPSTFLMPVPDTEQSASIPWLCFCSPLVLCCFKWILQHDKQHYCYLTFRMNVVGFEALVLETIISRELFSCSATTPPGPPSCFLSFRKGQNFSFWPAVAQRLKSVVLVLPVWCLIVEMYSNLTLALKKKKINQVINLNFIWLLFFSQLDLPEGMFSEWFNKTVLT